jgi:hypothetical protein
MAVYIEIFYFKNSFWFRLRKKIIVVSDTHVTDTQYPVSMCLKKMIANYADHKVDATHAGVVVWNFLWTFGLHVQALALFISYHLLCRRSLKTGEPLCYYTIRERLDLP